MPKPPAWMPFQDCRRITLLDALVVVAIVSIIGAFVAPGLLRSRVQANEVRCQAALKQIVCTEGVWRQTDADGNGVQDYWTRDVAGFSPPPLPGSICAGPSPTPGSNPCLGIAHADQGGVGHYPGMTSTPFAGYWFTVMSTDESGAPYQQQLGTSPGRCTNQSKFGFCGYPETYGATGIRLYIVNEAGVVRSMNTGTSTPIVTWPANDPSTCGWTGD